MIEVHLRIIEIAAPPAGVWTAELWSGFPGSAESARLAGGVQQYTQAQLERDGQYQGVDQKLDKASVLEKIRSEDQPNLIFPAIGLRLHELLEATGVAQEWAKLRTPTGLRTYLEIPDYISEWPWELLAWETLQNQIRYGFNGTLHPILRVTAPIQGNLKWTDCTVRILLISGQETLDATFKASEELRLIRKIFHQAGLSVLVELCEAPANAQDLEAKIDQVKPHILHFIGHGDIEGKIPGAEYTLLFHNPPNAAWEWPTGLIGQFFDNSNWKPRLVVLNACHTSQRDEKAASVADTLLGSGISAVIGAQAALRVDYARHFAEKFYGAVADETKTQVERSLDKAMAVARSRLSDMGPYQGLRRRHWALPILKVSAPVDEILRFRPVHTQVMGCEVVKEVFSRPGRFVNRTADRWSLLSTFAPALASARSYRGVILTGGSSLGKSWLVKRSVRDFLDSGYLVRYATLPGPKAGRTSLDVLHEWRGRSELSSFLLRPIPAPHFADFDARLAEAKQKPTAAAVQLAFAAFKHGLQNARMGRKVLLILGRFRHKDYATVSTQDFREGLLEQLLLPIQGSGPIDPDVDGICALLIVRDHSEVAAGQISDFDEYGLAQLDGFHLQQIKGFKMDQIDNLFDEFADFATNSTIKAFREGMRGLVQKEATWSPKTLKDFEPLVVAAQQLPSNGGP
jgi:hypothetical protein